VDGVRAVAGGDERLAGRVVVVDQVVLGPGRAHGPAGAGCGGRVVVQSAGVAGLEFPLWREGGLRLAVLRGGSRGGAGQTTYLSKDCLRLVLGQHARLALLSANQNSPSLVSTLSRVARSRLAYRCRTEALERSNPRPRSLNLRQMRLDRVERQQLAIFTLQYAEPFGQMRLQPSHRSF
jgi:hypothetical protein